ncbi:hypothetical protein COW46_00845 [Candidatus Gracilibacteria bacterium CG17_big_fil_post_rev_8_21_14_2_50_48_13]|nr:MAG: hypothetical protein COW46_00845 [Candidatus Gracilibacteria bacterium CG17_big_fil_post_rev_8_21_14_2_50_48_13]
MVNRDEYKLSDRGKKTEAHKKLLGRVIQEFNAAFDTTNNLFDEWEIRTKMLNNQMKDKNSVGVPLMYTTLNTVVSALYDDKLGVTHIPYSSAGSDRAQALDQMALNDYRVMKKGITDYHWIWDAAFYGHSPLLMQGWCKDKQVPEVELMDPMTFFYDPTAVFVNPFMGKTGLRFFGRQRIKSIDALKGTDLYKQYFNHAEFVPHRGSGDRVEQADLTRKEMQNLIASSKNVITGGPKSGMLVTEWWTFDDEGKRVYIEVMGQLSRGLDESCIIRYEQLDFQDNWPLVNRVLIPLGETFRGISIPDLTEDKQRYTAKFLNLALKSAEFATYGQYIVNTQRLSLDEVGTPAPNKLIASDGDPTNAMIPVQREGLRGEFQWVMNYMDQVSQQATATPAIAQGMTPDKSRSATEIAQQSSGVDRRHTLSAKILGWSETEYYEQWYRCYKKFFPKAGEKVIRLMGEMGTLFTTFGRTDFMDDKQPEVYIQSAVMGEIERTTKLQNMTNVMQVISADPNVNTRYMFRKVAELSDFSKEEVEMLLPRTPEELHAEGENDLILKGETPRISMRDDHMAHLEIHAKLPEGPLRDAHIAAHKKAMLLARMNPEIMPAPNAVNPANMTEANPEVAAQQGVTPNPTAMNFKSPVQTA